MSAPLGGSAPQAFYGPFTGFPPAEAYSQAFFDEAIRHLEDALVLHRATRWAAAITSAMKCSEIAIKGGVMLDGALGWWDKIEQTHAPFAAISQHVVLKSHAALLVAHNPSIGAGLKTLEGLVSDRSGGAFSFDKLVNTEYPFYSVGSHPKTHQTGNYISSPGVHFSEIDSNSAYTTSRDLLLAYQAISPTVTSWGLVIPEAI